MQPQTQVEAASADESQIQPEIAQHAGRTWAPAMLVGFRFAFAYFLLYRFPGLGKLWQALVTWTAAHVIHSSHPLLFAYNGSTDRLNDYLQNLLVLVFAVAAAAIWSVLDRRRGDYRYLHEWLRLYLRVLLGLALLSYGASKVMKQQMSYPSPLVMLEPYGNSSPMGLLWALMGYSTSYSVFAGLVEMVGGALVLVPRLATLGALVSAAAMANVFMLNMSYDVPVKLFSFNLLLMSCFLLLPEAGRLVDFFVLNRPVTPAVAPPLFRRKELNAAMLSLQLLILAAWSSLTLLGSYVANATYGDLAPRPPLYGIYNVDAFTVNGQLHPPLFTYEAGWRRVVFDTNNRFGIQKPDDSESVYSSKIDQKARTLVLSKRGDPKWKATFSMDFSSPGLITLAGEMDGQQIKATLRKTNPDFLLNTRGFHWINDAPLLR